MKQKENQPVKKAEVVIKPVPALLNPSLHFASIIVCALVLYLPTLSYPLTYYDDATLIDNIRQFINSKHPFTEIFSQSVFGTSTSGGDYFYRPMLTLSLYVDAIFSNQTLTGFHFTNVLIHLSATCLLYLFMVKMKFNRVVSWACSLFFVVHPALMQAVAWIPGRNDSLVTLFALASFLFLIKYLETGKLLHLALHLFFFFLSLLTKETAVLLPVLYFFTRKIFENNETTKKANRVTTIPLAGFIACWIAPAALFFIIRRAVLGTTVGLPLSFTIENFLKNLPALIQYTGKMLLPFNLSTFPILPDTTFIFGIVTVVTLLFFLIRSKNLRKNYLMLGCCWLLLFLSPAILRTNDNYESVFLEHRLYFPIIGFFLLWLETDLLKNTRFENPIPAFVAGGLVMLFLIISFNQRNHYKDEFSYWSNAVATSPGASFAHKGLGTNLFTAGKYPEAEKEYETAIQLNPGLKEVRNNLGRIYLNNGQNDKAEQLFHEELRINPTNAAAWYNLGLIRLNEKNIPAAETMVRKSLEVDPNYTDAQNDLCVILAMQKKYDEATLLCIKILEANPGYESAKKNLNLIFNAWENSEKVNYYKNLMSEKGL